jgi:hypothetical protein
VFLCGSLNCKNLDAGIQAEPGKDLSDSLLHKGNLVPSK